MIRSVLAWIGFFAILIFGLPAVGMAVKGTAAVGKMVYSEVAPFAMKGITSVKKAMN